MANKNSGWKSWNLRTLAAVTRSAIAGILGKQFGTDRDLYNVLGYRTALEFEHYYAKYLRQDIARRVVEAPARNTWRGKIRVTEDEDAENQTEFEQAWEKLETEYRVSNYLQRADSISGIGRYGVLLIGVADGRDLKAPVAAGSLKNGNKEKKLLYLRPLSESQAKINKLEEDKTNPRFGLPVEYNVDLGSTDLSVSASNTIIPVHHSRVIHIAENRTFDEVYGTPRLEAIYNRLEDLEKVVGGTAEMYWQNAVRGMHINVDPEFRLGDLDGDIDDAYTDLQAELDEYFNGIRRVIRTQGVEITPLEGQTPDPYHTFQMLISVVSAATGIPKRILMGSERGELASAQDEVNWNSRIKERRIGFAEPDILRAFVDRMLEWGIIPAPAGGTYHVIWPTLFEKDEKEEAEIVRLKLEALSKYTPVPETVVAEDEMRIWLGLLPKTDEQKAKEEEEPLDETDRQVQEQFDSADDNNQPAEVDTPSESV